MKKFDYSYYPYSVFTSQIWEIIQPYKNLLPGNYNYRLKQIDFNGNYNYHNLSNEVLIGVPAEYRLSQNFPNPFNPVTVINYQLPAAGNVSLKIFDVSGREVVNLINEKQTSGSYDVTFDAGNFSSGVYFYSLSVEGKNIDTKRMVVLK
ncbi:MAG: T9SS type A sorting domain-containing protein [bacterium]